MSRRGLFIVVESLDGVGKTTLVRGLAKILGGFAMTTPGHALRHVAADILAALGDDQIARCLFYSATVHAEGARARRMADQGEIVVMDRYWLSTIAYARARGVVADLTAIEALVPRPDLTVLLTLDEAERQRRLLSRGNATAADIETLDPTFRETVLREMRQVRCAAGMGPIEVDITGADQAEAIRRVLDRLAPWRRARRSA